MGDGGIKFDVRGLPKPNLNLPFVLKRVERHVDEILLLFRDLGVSAAHVIVVITREAVDGARTGNADIFGVLREDQRA